MFDLSSRVCTRQVPSYHRAAENQPASRRWWRRWTCQLARMIRVTREWWPFASSERQFIGSRREVRFALGFLLLLSRISQSRNNFSFLPLLSHQIETKVITYWLLQQPLAIRIDCIDFSPRWRASEFLWRRITIVQGYWTFEQQEAANGFSAANSVSTALFDDGVVFLISIARWYR